MRNVPGPDASDLDWLIFEQAGVLTTAQAEQLITPGKARGHLRLNRWRRLCRGILLAENGLLRRDQQLWAAVLLAGRDAHLAGATAATEGGLTGLSPDPIEVLVPAIRSRSLRIPQLPPDMPPIRLYRTAALPEHHRQIGRPPRTTIARAAIDGAAWARTDRAAAGLIARAYQQGCATTGELRAVLDMFPTIRRHRLIGTTIADLAGGAMALSEIDLLALCRRHRIPAPNRQAPRTDGTGRMRFVDAHWADARLLVEVDGGYHLDVRQWAADMLRQNEIWISGDRILRFPAWLVRAEPATVATQIRAALAAALRPPAPPG
ncbi:hypothetical protein BJ973_005360 [Actinoplanes tereljensis]|uniref:DUF559 domain-containing protein n=1 Tax=Paractinoplanes tereljensis TaxID=571912 RepID=A0A919NNJ2_9ACTN|nr:DUF559 domain-containing protein [Actinoplanes tereljensis]GIF21191.1 hypothetical protein Ate02nite_39210 [Actinoplanes tereljensis]